MYSNSRPVGVCERLFSFITCETCPPTAHDSEIKVDFRHTDTPDSSTKTSEPTTVQNGLDEKEKTDDHSAPRLDQKTGFQDMEGFVGTDAREKRPKKSITIKGSVGEDETVKKGEGKLSTDQGTKTNNQHHQFSKPKPPRHWGPLLSVASNINQKVDAFIRSRKRAMGRSHSLETEKPRVSRFML